MAYTFCKLCQNQFLITEITNFCAPCQKPTFKNPDVAFDDAIRTGRLSTISTNNLYAGKYMYMGTYNGVDSFKNINTRQYI